MQLAVSSGALFALVLFFTPIMHATEQSALPIAAANDNRTPAGIIRDGVLELKLELRAARWYPEAADGGHVDAYAFAEVGGPPQISGPLIRVPQATQIHLSVRNTLAEPSKIYGFSAHPAATNEPLSLAPGEQRELLFSAGDPGTYLYWATTSNHSIDDRDGPETTLGGAFVVDPPGARADDRVFVLNVWAKGLDTLPGQEIAGVNGKSWPYAERLTYKTGDTIHWRIVNPTISVHGMHLHGFYFTVDGVGDSVKFTRYSEAQRRQVVTEGIDFGRTFDMTWTPERAGNWLFHCHMLVHMTPSPALHPRDVKPASESMDHGNPAGMGGLVLGITVIPGSTASPTITDAKLPRKLQLVISDNPAKLPLYKMDLNDPALPPTKPEPHAPPSLLGPPIVLTRGEPVEIEIKNQLTKPTAIHWHGIELESYYDGVPGWTGSGQRTTPPIVPGYSFIARMTPPRAGTFIYHTHWHDEAQILNGLYGPLIVLEPSQKYDPAADLSLVFGVGNYPPFGFMMLINGNPAPDVLRLQTDKKYRLRLINITDNESDLRLRLWFKDESLIPWKVIAKDGRDLPPLQIETAPADIFLTVGATCDVELQVDKPGNYSLLASSDGFQGVTMQAFTFTLPKQP